jgi:hypothetical protein
VYGRPVIGTGQSVLDGAGSIPDGLGRRAPSRNPGRSQS